MPGLWHCTFDEVYAEYITTMGEFWQARDAEAAAFNLNDGPLVQLQARHLDVLADAVNLFAEVRETFLDLLTRRAHQAAVGTDARCAAPRTAGAR